MGYDCTLSSRIKPSLTSILPGLTCQGRKLFTQHQTEEEALDTSNSESKLQDTISYVKGIFQPLTSQKGTIKHFSIKYHSRKPIIHFLKSALIFLLNSTFLTCFTLELFLCSHILPFAPPLLVKCCFLNVLSLFY